MVKSLALAAFVAVVVLNVSPVVANEPAQQLAFFEKDVAPILKQNCFKCHGGEKKVESGLRLTSREGILKGGDSGPAVDLDSPGDSLLLSAINYDELEMPPKGKLPPEQIDVLTRWVKMGLPYKALDIDSAHAHKGPPQVNEENRQFWSFQKVARPDIPQVKNEAWVVTPVDAFVLHKLESAGLSPNPPAAKIALLRRLYYDLVGLPPSPREVRAFLEDQSPEAYEKTVDRLLNSPHYGEKWGRHWLDLVRYAETNSYERDDAKPEVWRYRDYVIRAFNEDKPYDQFVREQLAGDELEQRTPDSIMATGFYRLGRWDDEPVDATLAWYDDLDDVLATTCQVFLGLTMNCCRCHDHKLDPLPQEDYYRFLAFFAGVTRYGGPNRGRDVGRWSLENLDSPDLKQHHAEKVAAHKAKLDTILRELSAIEQSVMPKLLPVEKEDFQYDSNRADILKQHVPQDLSTEKFQQYISLRYQRDSLQKNPPGSLGRALCVKETKPREMHVLLRGNPQGKGKPVQPGFPQILGFDDPQIPEAPQGAATVGRRRVLADWIADEKNPLTARVFVNRLWQFHFGRGLVRSPNNFGLEGIAPTHPELLDWLASDFMAEGWRVKRLHKTLVMSNTYRQSSRARAEALEKDPENDHFWRFDMRRLTAEELRDSILAVSGQINLKVGGPSVYPVIPQEVLAGQSRPGSGWPVSQPENRTRRSVYIHVKRSLLVPLLENHDMADVDATCAVRFTTTVPAQALGLLNSRFMNEQAVNFATYVKEKAGEQRPRQVEFVLSCVTQRVPTEKEIERGLQLMDSLRSEHSLSDENALKYFCLMALNLNEFVYLD